MNFSFVSLGSSIGVVFFFGVVNVTVGDYELKCKRKKILLGNWEGFSGCLNGKPGKEQQFGSNRMIKWKIVCVTCFLLIQMKCECINLGFSSNKTFTHPFHCVQQILNH